MDDAGAEPGNPNTEYGLASAPFSSAGTRLACAFDLVRG
jgi:hypothetical protein